MIQNLSMKYQKLQDYLKSMGSVAVAFSGGVDSTFLLYAAKEALGDRVIAVKELGIASPLRHAGLNKEEIRSMSREFGLPTWDKQSFACLSSRFVYGETNTEEKLQMVDKAEQLLLDLGFRQVRVRIHGDIARIELTPQEFEKLMREDVRKTVYAEFKSVGFSYVTLDLLGYRTGSMNETLEGQK